MSVIGTTLKQPRVFAHDAVALKDLPGCTWRGVTTFTVSTPGVNYVVGQEYATFIPDGSGIGEGCTIKVLTIDGGGGILTAEIYLDPCGRGNGYNVGQVLEVINPGAPHPQNATITVDTITDTAWDFGCPFTNMYMALSQDPDYASAAGNNIPFKTPNLSSAPSIESLKAFIQKTKYTYTCGCEPAEDNPQETCVCTYETPGPGAAIYVGAAMSSIAIIMESENEAVYHNVPAGTFLPISALSICDAIPVDEGEDPKSFILALF
jgi:hypothetical protein